jgi:16S rRNA (cytosine967-C5)-methyltransferase
MITARFVAWEILHTARSANAWVGELIDEQLSRSAFSSQDRRLVTQLVMGVVRHKGTLDAMMKPFINRPFHEVEPALVDLLRLGTFQIAFLTQIPRHAAVHETVELAEAIGNPRAKGFINGILRRISELVTDEFLDSPAANALPFQRGTEKQYRKLTQDVFGDPQKETAAYLIEAFSWPRWLAFRWLEDRSPEECFRLAFWFNSPPPIWLRVNKLSIDRPGYELQLQAERIEAEPGEHPQSLRLVDQVSIRELPGYTQGDFAIQDLSAMGVASALNPQPGWRVLDLCSAPGGKTSHLAELMNNQGSIVACDIDENRLRTVSTLCHRLGVKIVETVLVNKFDPQPPVGPFDAALVDVPCSNTGVLGRRPEVRWRLHPSEFEELIRLQTRLLFTALDRVKPNGIVVYSTCSVEKDENQGVVNAVRRGIRGLIVEAEHHAIPGQPADGGYWCRIRKPG